MLDFESLNEALCYARTGIKIKYTSLPNRIYEECCSRLNEIKALLWTAEISGNYETQESAKLAINAFYEFAVKNGLVPAGKIYLADKLKTLVDFVC